MDRQPNRFVAARGAAALIIAMGIGRFAFTPLLPPMQAEAQFSNAAAGLLASVNLVGYLVGALLAGRMAHDRREAAFRISLAVIILTDVFTAVPLGIAGWSVVRCVAGISSGLVFVFATAFVIEQRANTALHFAGVGLGIVLSGLIAAFVPAWQTAWFVLAGLSVLLALFAMGLEGTAHSGEHPHIRQHLAWSRPFVWLTAAYALEGLGYIISGTFLVALLHSLPGTAGLGALAWVFVGVGAIASPLVWGRLATLLGSWRAVAAAYAVQALSIVLPFAGGGAAALAGGILFGGTFVGIVGISLPLAARLRPAQASQAVARLTTFYSIGQAVGPFLAGLAAEAAKGFALPLSYAAAVVAAAGVLSLIGEASARSDFHSGHFGETNAFEDRLGEDAGPRHN
ncbi:MAG: YbfB/YjiJ family MFS transporter [Beijerinckiaceae bacterium]